MSTVTPGVLASSRCTFIISARPVSSVVTSTRDALELEPADQLLDGHEPYPAVVVDRQWTLVSSNRAVSFRVAMTSSGL